MNAYETQKLAMLKSEYADWSIEETGEDWFKAIYDDETNLTVIVGDLEHIKAHLIILRQGKRIAELEDVLNMLLTTPIVPLKEVCIAAEKALKGGDK